MEPQKKVLVPMVVEVFGTWGERSEEAFALVSKACGNRASETARAAGAHIRRSLSVCLQRLNARILLAHRDPQTEIFAEPVATSLCLDSDLRPFEDGVADFLRGP